MKNNKIDPQEEFFQKLINSEKENEILSMIFKGLSNDQIIEKLIEYTESGDWLCWNSII